MKTIRYLFQLFIVILLLSAISCKKNNNEFGVEDTFTVDSILVSPATDIDQAFEIGWAVTTTGYPAFFVKLYLSNDNTLDTLNDVKITDTGSADIFSDLNKAEETQFYYISPVPGSNTQVYVYHNEKTSDPNGDGWEHSEAVVNPSGQQKYIIGYFYNTPGLQIKYGRRLLAVPVTFK